MPKLILFAACEKVITDTEGLVSLITLIEKLEVSVPSSIELPPRTAVPMRWQTLSVWQIDQADMGQYEQTTDLVVQDGTIAMHTEPKRLESSLAGRTGVKITGTLTAVPITDGPLRLRLSYRKIGEQDWIEVAEYPVTVSLVRT